MFLCARRLAGQRSTPVTQLQPPRSRGEGRGGGGGRCMKPARLPRVRCGGVQCVGWRRGWVWLDWEHGQPKPSRNAANLCRYCPPARSFPFAQCGFPQVHPAGPPHRGAHRLPQPCPPSTPLCGICFLSGRIITGAARCIYRRRRTAPGAGAPRPPVKNKTRG